MRPTRVATSAACTPPSMAARRLNILVQSLSRVMIMARSFPSRLRQELHLRLGEHPRDDRIERDRHEARGDHRADRREARGAGKADTHPADQRGCECEQRECEPGKPK